MKLIENWRQGWKFYTTWFFAFMLLWPDIYQAAQAIGIFDDVSTSTTERMTYRIMAVTGLALRFIKQSKPEKTNEPDKS